MLDMKKLIAKMLDKSVRPVIDISGEKSASSGTVTALVPERSYGAANSGLYLITGTIKAVQSTRKDNDLQCRLLGTGMAHGGIVQRGSTDSNIGIAVALIGTGGNISLGTYQTAQSSVTIEYSLQVIKLA